MSLVALRALSQYCTIGATVSLPETQMKMFTVVDVHSFWCLCRAWWRWLQKITTTSGPRRRKLNLLAKVCKQTLSTSLELDVRNLYVLH